MAIIITDIHPNYYYYIITIINNLPLANFNHISHNFLHYHITTAIITIIIQLEDIDS